MSRRRHSKSILIFERLRLSALVVVHARALPLDLALSLSSGTRACLWIPGERTRSEFRPRDFSARARVARPRERRSQSPAAAPGPRVCAVTNHIRGRALNSNAKAKQHSNYTQSTPHGRGQSSHRVRVPSAPGADREVVGAMMHSPSPPRRGLRVVPARKGWNMAVYGCSACSQCVL